MWPFSPRKIADTASKGLTDALDDLSSAITDPAAKVSALHTRLDSVESQHRTDHLEMLDMHERVKTSLAKLNRRKREADVREDDEPDKLPQPDPVPRVSLLSRRGRG